MQRQVITIGPNGEMSGLQRKPGQGIDLRQFGHAEIERASLVEWSVNHQGWYVDVLQDAGKGRLTLKKWHDAGLTTEQLFDIPSHFGSTEEGLLFAEYDDGVKAEIAYLDALRLKGKF